MAMSYCREPNCPHYAVTRGLCPLHRRQRERERSRRRQGLKRHPDGYADVVRARDERDRRGSAAG
jgi:hypothetical protein